MTSHCVVIKEKYHSKNLSSLIGGFVFLVLRGITLTHFNFDRRKDKACYPELDALFH